MIVPCLVFIFGFKFFGISQYAENTVSYTLLALVYGFILFALVSLPGYAIAKSKATKLLARSSDSNVPASIHS